MDHNCMRIIFLILFFSQISPGRTIVEPSFSLGTGSLSAEVDAGDSTLFTGNDQQVNAEFTTGSLGVRYGVVRDYIHVTGVLEGHFITGSASSADVTTGSNPQEVEVESDFVTNIGVGIGWEWNIPLRTYLIIGFPFMGAEIDYFFSENILIGFRFNRMTFDFGGPDVGFNTFSATVSIPIEFDYPSNWWRKKIWE